MNFLIDDQSCDLLTGVAELQSGFLLIDRKAPAAKLRGDTFQKPFIVLRKRAVIRWKCEIVRVAGIIQLVCLSDFQDAHIEDLED